MELSIIVPCYNEELTIKTFYNKVVSICNEKNISYEIIFVDDGSSDSTMDEIKKLCLNDTNIHYLSFSRNFGKDSAILAGLKKAQGEYSVVMDADLQDPPELLPEMIQIIKNSDIDCVETRRKTRKGEPVIRSLFAKIFCQVMNAVSNVNITDGIRDFRLMKKSMVDAIVSIKESNRFSKGLFSWVGFKTKCITYDNIERTAGCSKWSFWSLFKYAANGMISFSTLPLYLPLIFGVLLFLGGLVGLIINFDSNRIFILSTMSIFFGLNSIFIGFLGLYLAKIHTETQKRPLYIIREEK